MGTPFFSVIVPEHNSAAFMRTGLDSIRRQTFTDYELIVVCDACQDETPAIAREYTDKVFEIDAHRCGLARNKGLDEAMGEWILFMDDDDWWLHEFAFELIAKKAADLDPDVNILAFSFLARNLMRPGLVCYENTQVKLWPAIWNKAWKRSFIGDHRFPDWKCSDDYGFAIEMHPLGRFSFWDMPLYYYNYMREGSLSWRANQGEFK